MLMTLGHPAVGTMVFVVGHRKAAPPCATLPVCHPPPLRPVLARDSAKPKPKLIRFRNRAVVPGRLLPPHNPHHIFHRLRSTVLLQQSSEQPSRIGHREANTLEVPIGWHSRNRTGVARSPKCCAAVRVGDDAKFVTVAVPIEYNSEGSS